jgi:DNA (cytosine-5)-methyltransferase 1
MNKIKSIDLFAGVGGLRIGLEKALKKLGFKHECVFYSEIDKNCRKTYEKNFPKTFLIEDIKSVRKNNIKSIIPDHNILLAGFPCQPFSQAGISVRNSLERKHGFQDKDQGNLFFNILDILNKKRPETFLLENVQNLVTYNNGKVIKKILKLLRKNYYVPDPQILDARDFGLAQRRRRVYIVGFLNKSLNNFVYPERIKKELRVKDFLEHKVDDNYTISNKLWSGHINRKKRNKKNGKGFGFKLTHPLDSCTNTISSRYYKDGSECLISQGLNKNPRKLTPRECFRLQGFPESFKISSSKVEAYKQAGNAVPINVVEKICYKIINYLLSKENKLLNNKIAG